MTPIVKHNRIKSFLLSEFGFAKPPFAPGELIEDDPVLSLLVRITERYKNILSSDIVLNSTADPEMSISKILEHIEAAFSGDSNSPKLPVLFKTLIESDYFYLRFYRELHSIYSIEQLDLEEVVNESSLKQIPSERTNSSKNKIGEPPTSLPISSPSPTKTSRNHLTFLLRAALPILSVLILLFYFFPTAEEPTQGLTYGISTENKPVFKSNFRDNSNLIELGEVAQQFLQVYWSGGSSYVINDFTKTIETLEPLHPLADQLINDSLSTNIHSTIRNYYFYLGASYLVLSQLNVHKNKKSENIQQGLHYLLIAESLAGKLNLPNQDREAYYIGLAHFVNQRSELMHQYLDAIPDSSRFYPDSKTLRKHL